MQYWIDRVHVSGGVQEVKHIPISFVAPVELHDQLKTLCTPEDEIVDAREKASHEWVFVLLPGDVLPVQIIASIHTTFQSTDAFDRMIFPIAYRGYPVEEERLYRTTGELSNKIMKSIMPIFNLNTYSMNTST